MRLTTITLACILICLAATDAAAGDGPVLTVTGTAIDPTVSSDPIATVQATVDAGTELQYCWTAEPGTFDSPLASYRYGWNLIDPADPNDPGWAVPLTAWDGSSVCSDMQAFVQGAPTFDVEVRDEADVVSRLTVQIQVIQAVPTNTRSWTTVKATFAH